MIELSDKTLNSVRGHAVSHAMAAERLGMQRESPLRTNDFSREKKLAVLTTQLGQLSQAVVNFGEGATSRDLAFELLELSALAASWAEAEES